MYIVTLHLWRAVGVLVPCRRCNAYRCDSTFEELGGIYTSPFSVLEARLHNARFVGLLLRDVVQAAMDSILWGSAVDGNKPFVCITSVGLP